MYIGYLDLVRIVRANPTTATTISTNITTATTAMTMTAHCGSVVPAVIPTTRVGVMISIFK